MQAAAADLQPDRPLRVGYYDNPSSRVVAEIYARALRDAGLPTDLTVAGADPVLLRGLRSGGIDVVPVYVSAYADWLDGMAHGPGNGPASYASAADAAQRADALGAPLGVDVLTPSVGQDAPAFLISRSLAEAAGITTLSQFAEWSRAGTARMGGDPSCRVRPACLPHLLAEPDVVATYEQLTGATLGDLTWYHVYNGLQWCIVFMRTGARQIHFGEIEPPADIEALFHCKPLVERILQEAGA